MFAVNTGKNHFKRRGGGKAFTNCNFDICLLFVCGFWILKLCLNIVDGLLKLHAEKRRSLKPEFS